jgi:hypothetical protein
MVDAVSAGSAAQARNVQSQIATQVLKQKLDSESSVLQLLEPVEPAQSSSSSSANLGPGVGGNVDKSA